MVQPVSEYHKRRRMKMVSCDMYTIVKKVNYSNHTDFLICNRCIIDYDPASNDHIDVYVNKMENRLFDTAIFMYSNQDVVMNGLVKMM